VTDAEILRAAMEVIRRHPLEIEALGFDDGGDFTIQILQDLAEEIDA
jgi:hypothetical protein